MKLYTTMPAGFCECPVCEGTGLRTLTAAERTMTYYRGKAHTQCNNCGGQYMMGQPQGVVRVQPNGAGCLHNYRSMTVGNCLTRYTCQHCKEQYVIDSGG